MPLIQTFRHNITNSKRKIFTTFFTRSFAAGVPPTTDSEWYGLLTRTSFITTMTVLSQRTGSLGTCKCHQLKRKLIYWEKYWKARKMKILRQRSTLKRGWEEIWICDSWWLLQIYMGFIWSFHIRTSLLKHLESFVRKFRMKEKLKIVSIRSDHGGEFENALFKNFFDENGISLNFSCPRTPLQNSVVERKNKSLQEMARTLISESCMLYLRNSFQHGLP